MAKGTAKSNAKSNRQRMLVFAGVTAAITVLHLLILYFSYNSNYRSDDDDDGINEDTNEADESHGEEDDGEEEVGDEASTEQLDDVRGPGYWSYTNLKGVTFWLVGHQLPALYMLQRIGTPKYSASHDPDVPPQIISCVDLRDPKQLGIFAGFAQDILWLSWALQFLSLTVLPSGIAYVLYFIIPGLFVYQVYSFYRSMRRTLMGPGADNNAAGGDDDDDSSAAASESRQKRRQEAKQKKMNQMGGMRNSY